MAKFLRDTEINTEIIKIIEDAKERIILISPYIQLHDRLISALRTQKNNNKLKITVVFGKNKDDITKSMSQADFDFFADFPNIEIRYEKRLHAKYYANESTAVLTSMNLYAYSQNHNIEAGVVSENIASDSSLYLEARKYFDRVIDQSELIFPKTPQYRNTKSVVEEKRASRNNTFQPGFCIRTGIPIPFDIDRPFSYEAYQSWARYGNENFSENFCHFSGEESFGETTKAKPVLGKNWNEVKRIFNIY